MDRIAFAALLFSTLCIHVGCDHQPSRSDGVVAVEGTDQAMVAAIAKANATFGQFEKHWKRADESGIGVKFAMDTDSGGVEHIWFTPTKVEAERITANCGNDPVEISGLQFGDQRIFDRSKISDWMIMENGQCYGGYTIRVLVERQPENAPPFEFADYPQDQ